MAKKTIVLSAVSVAVIAAFFVFAQSGALYSVLDSMQLIPHAETFTELSFDDFAGLSARLPKTIEAGDTVSFSFVIHNVEGKTMEYPYVVSVVDATGATTTIDDSTVTIDNNASTTIREAYTFNRAQAQTTFIVGLPELNQYLHFFAPAKE